MRRRSYPTTNLIHSAHGAPCAVHTAVEVTHDCVRLAALEVVDMHVGRPVLPPAK